MFFKTNLIADCKQEPWWQLIDGRHDEVFSLDAVAGGLVPRTERTRYNPNRIGIYVIRREINGELIPGTVVADGSLQEYFWKGEMSFSVQDYEQLCGGSVDWVKCVGGAVPSNALPCGKTKDGQDIYMGRARKDGEYVVGRVDTSKAACIWVTKEAEGVAFHDFEILVC